jgi:hypothetical protein
VPGGGIEPPRAEARRILSPLRLPVPPSRRIEWQQQVSTAWKRPQVRDRSATKPFIATVKNLYERDVGGATARFVALTSESELGCSRFRRAVTVRVGNLSSSRTVNIRLTDGESGAGCRNPVFNCDLPRYNWCLPVVSTHYEHICESATFQDKTNYYPQSSPFRDAGSIANFPAA